jgi:hypothetical protein
MQLPYRGLDEGELRLSLVDVVSAKSKSKKHQGMLLLVDEAHSLPGKLLEELRLITNLVRGGEPRVRLVLGGNPTLEERLAHPRLTALSQRVSARGYLQPLTHGETREYIRSLVSLAGGQPDALFTSEALDRVYAATDGVPRLVNQLCDHVLMLAYSGGCSQIDAHGIDEAWADLQQLPSPWTDDATDGAERDGILEFGGLDDEDAPAAERLPVVRFGLVSDIDASDSIDALEVLTSQLDDMDEEFEPVGQLSPSLDADLSPFLDPFAESFDEEEVIVDRYSSAEEAERAMLPRVSTREGRVLRDLMRSYLGPEKPRLVLSTSDELDSAEAGEEEQELTDRGVVEISLRELSDVHRVQPEPAKVTPTKAPQAAQPKPAAPVAPIDSHIALSATAAAGPAPHVQVSSADMGMGLYGGSIEALVAGMSHDSDMIIVEDDPVAAGTVHVRPAAPARKQEYKQLFAKLRRS